MNQTEKLLATLENEIESFLQGQISFERMTDHIKDFQYSLGRNDSIDQVFHMLSHYDSDEDIMEKDPEYREYMKTQALEAFQDLKNSLS